MNDPEDFKISEDTLQACREVRNAVANMSPEQRAELHEYGMMLVNHDFDGLSKKVSELTKKLKDVQEREKAVVESWRKRTDQDEKKINQLKGILKTCRDLLCLKEGVDVSRMIVDINKVL